MRITKEQDDLLHTFRCIRVADGSMDLINSIRGCKDETGEAHTLVEWFRHPDSIEANRHGNLASYIIVAPDDTVLLFFSIRCGELFDHVDAERLKVVHDASAALQRLTASDGMTEDERHEAINLLGQAVDMGITGDQYVLYRDKAESYIEDAANEPSPDINRVSIVYPAVELKFFGRNEDAKDYWETTGLPHKAGEVLFWNFVVEKFLEIKAVVGCQFAFLFAADSDPDGGLVKYYKTRLGFNATGKIAANKPLFDYTSWFLYQDIEKLVEYREAFFDNFNPEEEPV